MGLMRIPCNFEQCSITIITDTRYKQRSSLWLNARRLSGLQQSSGLSLQDFPQAHSPHLNKGVPSTGTLQLAPSIPSNSQVLKKQLPAQTGSMATCSTSSCFAYFIPIQLQILATRSCETTTRLQN